MIRCIHPECQKTPQDGVRFYRLAPDSLDWACEEHRALYVKDIVEASRWDRFFTEHGVKQ